MKKRIAFIINPISGVSHKDRIPVLIEKYLDKEQFDAEVVFTRYAGHAAELAAGYAERGYDCVVAVGGDGTVNETASALCHTDTALAVVPTGSGNGLARHLHVALSTKQAIRQLNRSRVSAIDYGVINDKPFFCTCGMGFDAHISMEFCRVKKRGFFSYLRKIVAAFFTYKPQTYRLKSEEAEFDTSAFLVTVGNASQWGNGAYIAPTAGVKDGLLDVVILRKVGLLPALRLAFKLYTRRMGNDKYIKTWKTRWLVVRSDDEIPSHLDGEPFERGHEVRLRIVPGGLKVFCANDFQ